MSKLLHRLQDELMVRSTSALQALHAIAPEIRAAESLEETLKRAGITASSCGHIDGSGCTIAVVALGNADDVLTVLHHRAIPVEKNAELSTGTHAVKSFRATVMGKSVALAICERRGEEAELQCAA